VFLRHQLLGRPLPSGISSLYMLYDDAMAGMLSRKSENENVFDKLDDCTASCEIVHKLEELAAIQTNSFVDVDRAIQKSGGIVVVVGSTIDSDVHPKPLWEFAHYTFKEFFYARWMYRTAENNTDVFDSDWIEKNERVLLFFHEMCLPITNHSRVFGAVASRMKGDAGTLIQCSRYGLLEFVRYLLYVRKVDVDATFKNHYSPCDTSNYGHVDVMNLLLERGLGGCEHYP